MVASTVIGKPQFEVKLSRLQPPSPHLASSSVTFMSLYQYFSHLATITVKLQKVSLDIVAVHEMITEVKMI